MVDGLSAFHSVANRLVLARQRGVVLDGVGIMGALSEEPSVLGDT